MYTKDGAVYGGFLDKEDRTFVNWKDPLREISRSRTNFKDRMEDACTTAELGCVSDYVKGKYDDENVGNSEMEVSDRRRSLSGDERSELVGGWMVESESHGKTVMRYVCGQSAAVPELMNVLQASRGRKRRMEEEEPAEDGTAGFVDKHARVVSGIHEDDYRHSRKRVKIVDVDYHAATAQSPEPLKLVGHSSASTIISLDLNNKEVSERFLSSAAILSHIPRWNKTQTEEGHGAGGRFVRTSMRASFPANEHKHTGNQSPVQWSANSSDSMNGASQALAELPRNAGVPFNLDILDLVSIYKGSVQPSETLKNNLQGTAARVNSPPVFSEVSLAIGQSPLSQNSTETPVSDVKLRNSVIAQRSLLNRRIDEEVMCSTVSEFRHNTPSSASGIGHMVYVTQPGNGLTQIGFLPHSDLRVSNNSALHTSAYQRNTGQPPALERLSTGGSEERKSEERLWKSLEVSCERDLQEALWRRNEECGDPFPNNRPSDHTLKPESFHSRSIHNGFNAQVRCLESYPVTRPFERTTIGLQQPQRRIPTCKPDTGDSYKIELVRNEMFQRGEIPRKDKLISAGLSPPIRTRETSNRLSAWQREHDKKRPHRSKSLSPSMISNVESGKFGSLESIRRYYKSLGNYNSLGKTEMSSCLRIGSAEKQVDCCLDLQLQFIESKARRRPDEMPIDLSNRKREQSATERTAKSTTVTTPRNIDYCERGNAEISGGYMSQARHARSPTPGTIPVTPKGVPSERSWVDVSGNLLQVPSPSPSPLISQPSSRLSSPASMPDSHLPPKKRRIPSYLSSLDDSSTSPKEGLNVSTSPDVGRSPGCYHIPLSNEESLEIETKAQLEDKTDLPDRGVHHGQWQGKNCLENLEDVQWAITPDEDGDLPLHIGVARGSESYVRKCVGIMSRLGASLDVYDSNRKTALQLAVITSQVNMVEILLNASASPNVLDRNGANSVHLAVKHGELECLKCLLTRSNHVLDLDARNYEGLTALHISVISNQLEATRILLRVGASVNITDGKTGQTPLHYAAERNIQQMAKLLLVFGANPSTASYSGCTPVQLASAKSHLEMAKMLERGAFVLSSSAVATRKNLHVKEQ